MRAIDILAVAVISILRACNGQNSPDLNKSGDESCSS